MLVVVLLVGGGAGRGVLCGQRWLSRLRALWRRWLGWARQLPPVMVALGGGVMGLMAAGLFWLATRGVAGSRGKPIVDGPRVGEGGGGAGGGAEAVRRARLRRLEAEGVMTKKDH
eukprot:COSAG01_NODE_17198_length_1170_cov_620.306256_2_plen_115_part_00